MSPGCKSRLDVLNEANNLEELRQNYQTCCDGSDDSGCGEQSPPRLGKFVQ